MKEEAVEVVLEAAGKVAFIVGVVEALYAVIEFFSTLAFELSWSGRAF